MVQRHLGSLTAMQKFITFIIYSPISKHLQNRCFWQMFSLMCDFMGCRLQFTLNPTWPHQNFLISQKCRIIGTTWRMCSLALSWASPSLTCRTGSTMALCCPPRAARPLLPAQSREARPPFISFSVFPCFGVNAYMLRQSSRHHCSHPFLETAHLQYVEWHAMKSIFWPL